MSSSTLSTVNRPGLGSVSGGTGQARWFFAERDLVNTPSLKNGINKEKELSYRQQAANFIQDMGQRLQVTQLCINTAIVYMQRFYMFHSFTRFHRNTLSAAALFLAAKVEEQPRKLEHVIKVAHFCLHNRLRNQPPIDTRSDAYIEQAQELVSNENILLQTLGFDVAIDHPHTHVVKCCQLVKASKELAQTSYFMATNSLHLTTMCLRHPPTIVACVCIHLACKWSNYKIAVSAQGKEWFTYVDPTATTELLERLTEEFLNIFSKCPSRLKKKIMDSTNATKEEEERRAKGDINPSNYQVDLSVKQSSSSVPSGGQQSSSSSGNRQPSTSSSGVHHQPGKYPPSSSNPASRHPSSGKRSSIPPPNPNDPAAVEEYKRRKMMEQQHLAKQHAAQKHQQEQQQRSSTSGSHQQVRPSSQHQQPSSSSSSSSRHPPPPGHPKQQQHQSSRHPQQPPPGHPGHRTSSSQQHSKPQQPQHHSSSNRLSSSASMPVLGSSLLKPQHKQQQQPPPSMSKPQNRPPPPSAQPPKSIFDIDTAEDNSNDDLHNTISNILGSNLTSLPGDELDAASGAADFNLDISNDIGLNFLNDSNLLNKSSSGKLPATVSSHNKHTEVPGTTRVKPEIKSETDFNKVLNSGVKPPTMIPIKKEDPHGGKTSSSSSRHSSSSKTASLFDSSPPPSKQNSSGKNPNEKSPFKTEIKLPKVEEMSGYEKLRDGRKSIKVHDQHDQKPDLKVNIPLNALGGMFKQPMTDQHKSSSSASNSSGAIKKEPSPATVTSLFGDPEVEEGEASSSSDEKRREKKKKKKEKKEKKEKKKKEHKEKSDRKDGGESGEESHKKHKSKHKEKDRDRERSSSSHNQSSSSSSRDHHSSSQHHSSSSKDGGGGGTPGIKLKIKPIPPENPMKMRISLGGSGGGGTGDESRKRPAAADGSLGPPASKMSRVMGTNPGVEGMFLQDNLRK